MQKTNKYQEEIKELKKAVQEEFGGTKTPGLALGVFKDNQFIYSEGLGLADIEKGREVTTDTVFKFGSISKLFTCIGIMQQYEKGFFKLDDPVNDYLSAGKLLPRSADWKEVTFRHLLTHTAGIGELRSVTDLTRRGFRLLVYDNEPVPPLSSLHDLPLRLSAEPGSKFAYSNVGVSLLGYLIEIFSGEDFRDYIKKHILEPLGMKDSDFLRTPEIAAKEAKGYKYKKEKMMRAKDWINIVKPSGGLWSTINDMGRFLECLGNYGQYSGGRLLKKKTFEMIWSPQYWADDFFREHYCLGFIYWLYNINGKKVIGHTGGVSGFTAALWFIPEEKLGFVVAANFSELIQSRITERLRNRSIKIFTDMKDDFEPDREPDRRYWPQIKGYYGGYPGWFSNTRLILEGMEYKVWERDGHLFLSSLYGPECKGVKLYPTADPMVYHIPKGESGDFFYNHKLVFAGDYMARDFQRLKKKPLQKTVRFRAAAASLALLGLGVMAVKAGKK